MNHRTRQALLLLAAIVWRYGCHCLMLLPVLLNELRPAPHLPDLILDHLPQNEWLTQWNYFLWASIYFAAVVFFYLRDRNLFYCFVLTDGVVSLVRGLTIPLTGLGPPFGVDVNVLHPFALWTTWFALVNPYRALIGKTANIYLTKDLFFSGHTATTFLIYLFSRRLGQGRWIFLLLHVITVVIVFWAHLHYTIDVIGAYAITFAIFCASQRFLFARFGLKQCSRESAT
jgi:hypothetical protein